MLLAVLASPAFGNGWRVRTSSYYYSNYTPVAGVVTYYQVVPVYYVPAASVCLRLLTTISRLIHRRGMPRMVPTRTDAYTAAR